MFSKEVDVISVALAVIFAAITGAIDTVQDQAVVITGAIQGIAGLVGAFIGGIPASFRKHLGE